MNLMQIGKLDNNNYVNLHIQMKSVLVHSELWGVTCGREAKSEGAGAEGFDTKPEKASATILLCARLTQLNHVRTCTMAAHAWDKLKEIHQPKRPARKTGI